MKKEITIFDNPKNVKRLIYIFYAVLVILLAAEFLIHAHAHFAWEDFPFFNAVYGFVACVLVIFGSKLLRFVLKRDENYYEK